MALELRFLGSPAVIVDGHPAPLRHRRAVLLLALLALRGGRPAERTAIAETIWPEHEPEAASVSLRRALADLREMLGAEADRLVSPDRRTIALNVSCDVLEFDAAARRFERAAEPKDAERALDLYAGPLLEGWTDECLDSERRHRTELASNLAEGLARAAFAAGRADDARRWLERAEAISPLRESTLRLRLDVLLATGDGAQARVAYASFARRLERELGLRPSSQTARRVETRAAAPEEVRPGFAGPLVGRETELAEIREALDEGGLVTLLGPGGVGKTRLALEAVRVRNAAFVDLSALPPGAPIGTIAEAAARPAEVLVLDNAEHLLPAVAFVAEEAARGRQAVLVTSRSPLDLPGERTIPLAPLGAAEASALFAARAARARPSAPLDAARVERICRLLDGLPLALELAAARLRDVALSDLEARLEGDEGLDLLASGSPVAPERQRTLAKAVLWSVSLLSPEGRSALARLAAFRGGFSAEAAEAVLGAAGIGTSTLDVLSELGGWSLVALDDGEPPRYRMLETVRSVAIGLENPAESYRAMGRWAAEFAERAYDGLWHGDAARWASLVAREWANLRTAVTRGDAAHATRIVEAIDATWWRTGRFREGIEWREAAGRACAEAGDVEGAARHALSAELFRRRLGEPNRARAAFRERADACLATGDVTTAMYFLHSLGFIERDDGDLARAVATMREALAHAESVGEAGLVAYALRGVAVAELAMGPPAVAVSHLETALASFRQEGLRVQATSTTIRLAEARLEAGDPGGAFALARLAAAEAKRAGLATDEAGAEIVAARSAVVLGDRATAAESLGRAEAADVDLSPEGRAEIAVARSALARADGKVEPGLAMGILCDVSSASLPYPTLRRVVEEAAQAAGAAGLFGPARRLTAEATGMQDAALRGEASTSLAVVRTLAALPAEWLSGDER